MPLPLSPTPLAAGADSKSLCARDSRPPPLCREVVRLGLRRYDPGACAAVPSRSGAGNPGRVATSNRATRYPTITEGTEQCAATPRRFCST